MKNIKVSVIVPVHNSEKYIDICIKSLCKQKMAQAEFIFVDDGSIDNSVSIIEKYAQIDSRIMLFKQNHFSAGVARNNGINISKGEYIIFLDSDDFFKKNILNKIHKIAIKNNADVVAFGYQTYDDKTAKKGEKIIPNMPRAIFSPNNQDNLVNKLFTVPWNKLYKRQFIVDNNIHFSTIQKCEDVVFVTLSLSLAKCIVGVKKALICYRINNNSSSQGNVNNNVNCFVDSRIETKTELINRHIFDGKIKQSFYHNCDTIANIFNAITDLKTFQYYYEYVKTHLIPDLFESQEFVSNEVLNNCFYSKDVASFLFYYHQRWRIENGVKNSIYYRFGKLALYVPMVFFNKIIRKK